MVAALVIVVLALAAAALGAVVLHNRLAAARNGVAEGWSQVEVQLARRFATVDDLAAITRAYAQFEREALERVLAARAAADAAAGAGAAAARERPEAELHAQAAGLVARAEAYPELAANEQFRRLAEQLTRLEDDLSAARRYYNGRVRIYNTLRQSAPANLLAGPLGYRPAEYFQAELETPASLP